MRGRDIERDGDISGLTGNIWRMDKDSLRYRDRCIELNGARERQAENGRKKEGGGRKR